MARMFVALAAAIAAPALLTGCSGEVDNTPRPLTEKQSRELASQIDGKVAEKPVKCISSSVASNLVRISDDVLLYRASGRLVYKNQLRGGGCPGLARDSDIVVTETYGGQYCEGDLLRLVDRSSGIPGPSCILGEFTPYRKAS